MNDSLHHSADVDIFLELNGERIPVARCLENSCTLMEPRELPPFECSLCILVDGKEHRSRVYFRHGISKGNLETVFEVL